MVPRLQVSWSATTLARPRRSWLGTTVRPSPGQDPGDDAYLGDRGFDRIVEELIPGNGSRLWQSPSDGEVLIAVQSVQFEGDDRVGAPVVVQELSERDALLNETMGTYAVVAFLSLLLVLVIGWWQSGRLLSPLRTVRATAERIGATDLSQRLPVKGHDDTRPSRADVAGEARDVPARPWRRGWRPSSPVATCCRGRSRPPVASPTRP